MSVETQAVVDAAVAAVREEMREEMRRERERMEARIDAQRNGLSAIHLPSQASLPDRTEEHELIRAAERAVAELQHKLHTVEAKAAADAAVGAVREEMRRERERMEVEVDELRGELVRLSPSVWSPQSRGSSQGSPTSTEEQERVRAAERHAAELQQKLYAMEAKAEADASIAAVRVEMRHMEARLAGSPQALSLNDERGRAERWNPPGMDQSLALLARATTMDAKAGVKELGQVQYEAAEETAVVARADVMQRQMHAREAHTAAKAEITHRTVKAQSEYEEAAPPETAGTTRDVAQAIHEQITPPVRNTVSRDPEPEPEPEPDPDPDPDSEPELADTALSPTRELDFTLEPVEKEDAKELQQMGEKVGAAAAEEYGRVSTVPHTKTTATSSHQDTAGYGFGSPSVRSSRTTSAPSPHDLATMTGSPSHQNRPVHILKGEDLRKAVFVSYSRRHAGALNLVTLMVNGLRAMNKPDGMPYSHACRLGILVPWLDKEQMAQSGGSDWSRILASVQTRAALSVFFLSNAYCGSEECLKELQYADMKKHARVPNTCQRLIDLSRSSHAFLSF